MLGYGLDEKEIGTSLSEYNHALFKNMVSCLTSIWEINILSNKVCVMYDRFNQTVNGREFTYTDMLYKVADRFVGKESYNFFMSKMAIENMRNMSKEVVFECPLVIKEGDSRMFRFTLTPGEMENGLIKSVYFSSIDLVTEVDSMLKDLKDSATKLREDRDTAVRESKEKSEFILNMVSEMRDPMNSLMDLIDEACSKKEDHDELKNYIEKIKEEVTDIVEFVKNKTN